jgi:hypothetical protein
MCSLEGEKALRERPHLYFGSRQGDPHSERAARTIRGQDLIRSKKTGQACLN